VTATAVDLAPGWWCWLEVPAARPGWGASPVFIETVEPLKSGQGLLRLRFIQAMHPVGAVRRDVVLKVLLRATDHLVGTLRDPDGRIRTAILALPEYGWLATHCPLLLRARPPQAPTLQIVGHPAPALPSAARYLDQVLGLDAASVLRGASSESFGTARPPMPPASSRFTLGLRYPPFESWLVARGLIPHEMEEKWFIYLEHGRLLFRRSWTGLLIFAVETAWEGESLVLGEVEANRDPAQYKQTDDAQDRALLAWLIRVVLLGEIAAYPAAAGVPPAQAAVEAWAVAGKASQ
jgi:hypothetical protein